MQLFLGQIKGLEFYLDKAEIQHCVKVLRKTVGDSIHFICGDGNLYLGNISFVSKSNVYGSFTKVKSNFGSVPYDLTVAIAPTKNMDRFESFVEKAVEMGIKRIVPLICERSERKIVKIQRLEKIALSATKQSMKGTLTVISEAIPFKTFCSTDHSNMLIAHCEEDVQKTSITEQLTKGLATTILIGPEGDFSPSEIALAKQIGAKPLHLGSSRLRTETAGLVAVATVYQQLG